MVASAADSKDKDMVTAVAQVHQRTLPKYLVIVVYTNFHQDKKIYMLSLFGIVLYKTVVGCQVKAVAREKHLQDVQAKQKPKRKRGKQPDPNHQQAAPVPSSPDRVAKKVKPDDGDDQNQEPAPAEGSSGSGDRPEESNGTEDKGDEKPKAKAKASKRKDLEQVKEAWKEKEMRLNHIQNCLRL